MKARKILVSLAALALVAAISIGGTIAYLTSTDKVENSFTVGKVAITLDESKVDINGTAVTSAARVKANTYKLMPGHPYTMGLLASMPDIEQDKSVRLQPIPGSPPDMTNPPKGCPFAPRCPYARSICAAELPDFVEVGERHRTRCFLQYPDAPADAHNPFKKNPWKQ